MSQSDLFGIDATVRRVPVNIGDAFEERALTCLSSRMKQGLVTQIQQAIRALVVLQKAGKKIGSLKFKAFVECISLKQYSITYQLDRPRRRLKLQKLQQRVRMHGCCQLPRKAEVANPQLLRRQEDYYLHVVTYQAHTTQPCLTSPLVTAIGIDTSLQTQFTFSNGVAAEYRVFFSERLRWMYRAFSCTEFGSRNRHKLRVKHQEVFATLNIRKKEICNQLVSYLVRHYATICYQDELLRAWQRVYGQKMADLSLGAFLRILAERSRTPREIPSSFPSTQRCSGCGYPKELALPERTYYCPCCRLTIDQDWNTARNFLLEGRRIAPKEQLPGIRDRTL